jgi:ribonucleotide reductase beta subunit family protein with ferritin-like domain
MLNIRTSIKTYPEDLRKFIHPITPSRSKIWANYQLGINKHWDPSEIKYDVDYKQVGTLKANVLHTLTTPIIYFLQSDNNIIESIENTTENLYNIFELNKLYDWKKFNEGIHTITYEEIYDTIIQNPEDNYKYKHQISNIRPIQDKYDWLLKVNNHLDRGCDIHLLNICTEGIHFGSSFKLFQILKTTHIDGTLLLPGTCRANELIMGDENIHVEVECDLFNLCEEKPDENDVYSFVKKACALEETFIDYMLPEPLSIINREMMYNNMQVGTNVLLQKIGYAPLYDIRAADGYSLISSMSQKSSFFEIDATEYTRGAVSDFSFLNLKDSVKRYSF